MSSGHETKPKDVDNFGVKPPTRASAIAPFVFWPGVVIIGAFVIWAMFAGDGAGEAVGTLREELVDGLAWYYVPLVTFFVLFAIYLGVGKFGRIKLGKDDQKPDFSYGSWLAMLFAAGMGIGLVFWGVAEPLSFYMDPKPGVVPEGADPALFEAERSEFAMSQSFLHWGLHPWAIYIIVGLAVAYAVHRKGKPVSIRWVLEPIFGERVKGRVGDAIDVIALVGTVFGVGTSLGFGVMQIGAGLDHLGWITNPNEYVLSIIVLIITAIAIFSVVSGLDRGIKWLSNFNVVLAGGLLLFVLIAGSTMMLLTDTFQNIGVYIQNLPGLSLDTGSWFGDEGTGWVGGWTIFYWGWWMSWAPFVGIFIARISRGRTVREFVIGALAVPTTLSFFWFSVMGGTGLREEQANEGAMTDGDGAVNNDYSLFYMLDTLPGGSLVIGIAILLIVMFFVTSSDTASYVVDMLASGGDPNPPTWSRVFWSVVEGLVAVALLIAGGSAALQLLQNISVVIALPFSLIMIAMVVATFKSLQAEHFAYKKAVAEAEQQELVESTVAALENGGNGDHGTGGTSGGDDGGTGDGGTGGTGGGSVPPQDRVPTA